MFVIKPTNQTYSDPFAATFRPGIPFGREYSRGDMCFYNPEIESTKIFLNSNILREAMLNSKDYIEEALGIKITDAKATKKEKKEVVEEVIVMDTEDLSVPEQENKVVEDEEDKPKTKPKNKVKALDAEITE